MAELETPEIEREVGKSMKKTEGKLIRLKLKEIKPYKRNAKIHTEAQVGKIRDSIVTFGYKDLIAVDENNVILEGHGRLRALYQIDTTGYKEIPVWKITDLNESEKKAYRIAHNKLNLDTGFDVEILKEEFHELEDSDNFTDTGFETKEITEMWDNEKEVVEDTVEVGAYERAKNKTSIKLGEVYLLGNHRLMCGDSTESQQVEKLMNGEKADMVFTDPPYNVNIGCQNNPKFKVRNIENDNMSREDFLVFIDGFMKRILEVTNGGIYICMSCKELGTLMNSFENLGGHWSSTIIWLKNCFVLSQKDYHSKYEPILYGWTEGNKPLHLKDKGDRKQDDVWEFDKPHNSKLHPTMKPIELCSKAINNSSKTDNIVLDLFGGSGSTLIACEQLNRKCFMMELDPVYCQVIIDRWEKFTNQKAVKE